MRIFLEANLPSHGMAHTAAYDGLETAQEVQLRTEAEREETLRKALELLGDQSRFEVEIIKKPDTADEALGCLMTSRQLLRSGIHQHKEMIVVSRLLSSRTLLCFACCGVQG